jgi:predicted RNase H-like nuclease
MTNVSKATDKEQTSLLIGFDSAWTAHNSGALVGVVRLGDGNLRELGLPKIVNYPQAQGVISDWQAEFAPAATIIMLDQPTIVGNASGQRPVENIVGSIVSLRYGGMQPANTSKTKMFGAEAPVWTFLETFGRASNPLEPITGTQIFETYPVLTMIALSWSLVDLSKQARPTGRLPKYNPDRRKTFVPEDWAHVCLCASDAFKNRCLLGIAQWIDNLSRLTKVRKEDQDSLDACICLLVALQLADGKKCLMVGNLDSGYILVPYSAELQCELNARCVKTGLVSSDWVRKCSQC